MKKMLIAISAFFSFVIVNVSAQSANITITLTDVLSFTVSQPASLSVNFDSDAKYSSGIRALASDQISVVSSKGFVIKAIAGTVTGTAALPAGSVKLSSSIGSTNMGNTSGLSFMTDVVLPASAATPVTLVAANKSSWDGTNPANKFNISYLIGAGGAYAGKAAGANTIPVVFTVIQP
jgi:hypothetical protein